RRDHSRQGLGSFRGVGKPTRRGECWAEGARPQSSRMAIITPPRPLTQTDDRSRFDCGRESLNQWFRRHGWANHVAGISRTNVICEVATGDLVGYVTLSAGQIERAYLPKSQQRNRPDPIPVTLLGQLAVHKDHQGKGYARSLLLFALRTA